MIAKWFSRTAPSSVPHDLYGSVVAQSRQQVFYARLGVPDTVAGRFEMLCLHLFLLTHYLARSDRQEAKPLAQDVFDVFVQELDRALREMGVGDTSVPKRKKAMMRAYYAQIEQFDPPMEANDADALAERIDKRVFAGANGDASRRLAAYMKLARDTLASQPFDEILRARIVWPSVEIV